LTNYIIAHVEQLHELVHLLTDSSAGLPTAFELAIKTMITHCIAAVDDKPTTLSFIVTTQGIKTYPTAWSLFTFTG
jgi:hypothetical protein